jgi:hypothetical protein
MSFRHSHAGVGPGHPAQPRGGPGQRLVRFALAGSLEDPGHLGQQVGPAPGQRAQFGQRGRLLVLGERAPPGAMARFAGDLGGEQTVGVSPGRSWFTRPGSNTDTL